MNDYTPQVAYYREHLRPTFDESKSKWVYFPQCGKQFLLPIIARHQTLIPSFKEDGSIEVEVQMPGDLAELVERFFDLVASKTPGVPEIVLHQQAYSDFLNLVRRLLLVNYDLPQEEIKGLLTLTGPQLSVLFQQVFNHLLVQ